MRDPKWPGLTASFVSPEGLEEAESPRSLEQVQRAHVLAVLQRVNWRIEGAEGAAALLGLSPSTLRSRMKRLDIRRER